MAGIIPHLVTEYRYMQNILITATYAALLDTFVVGLRVRLTNCMGNHWDFDISNFIKIDKF